MSKLTRRAAAGLLLAAAVGPLRAAETARFRDIKLDLKLLRDTGDSISADEFAKVLPALLRKAFAAHLDPSDRSAPTLVARVDTVTYGSPDVRPGLGYVAIDFIAGAAVVISGGRTSATYPINASRYERANLGDVPTGSNELFRTDHLAELFAYWLPGQLGL